MMVLILNISLDKSNSKIVIILWKNKKFISVSFLLLEKELDIFGTRAN